MARFTIEGRAKVRFLTTEPTDPNAPTQTELSAGVDVMGSKQAEELVVMNGWEVQTSTIPTPGLSGLETGNVGGEQTYPDSSMEIYKDDTSATIYSALTKGTTGFMAIMMDGQSSGEECELFPVTVLSRVRQKAGQTGHKFTVNFALDVPYEATQAA